MLNKVLDQASVRASTPATGLSWHLITSEYPPQPGGVADYTHLMADGLERQGDEVHVWCPEYAGSRPQGNSVVHHELKCFSRAELKRMGVLLDTFPRPRRIVLQWVPHGYGYRTMNVGLCWWLWKRAKQGDHLALVVHEPFLSFRAGAWRQSAAALVHRLMVMLLLNAAARVWVTIPAWERLLRPWALGRPLQFDWLPIPSNIPVVEDPGGVQSVRRQYSNEKRFLIGHFGTFGKPIASLLEPILMSLADVQAGSAVLLMGFRSREFREALIRKQPALSGWLYATGELSAEQLSCHLSACDLLIQPYPDGLSTRRGSLMAALSHGKPIVSTSGEFTEPLWIQNDAVALVPAGDTEAFVKQVRRLSMDGATLRSAGRAALQIYQQRFDVAHTITALSQAAQVKDGPCAF